MSENNNMLGSTIQRAAPIQRAKPVLDEDGNPIVVPVAEQPEQEESKAVAAPSVQNSEVRKRTQKYRNVVADNYKHVGMPSVNSPYAVMPVGWNFGFLLAFCIPVLGFFIAVIWAAGGTKFQNQKNLAVAFILLQLSAVLLTAIAFLVLYTVAEGKLDMILSDIKKIVEMLLALIK